MTHRRSAFTLIEVLVVIGILGLLLAILLPAIGAVRRSSFKSKEMVNIREMIVGWQSYAGDANNRILPGYLAEDVQQQWKVAYPKSKGSGNVDAVYAQSYPFRLLSYVSFHLPSFYGYAEGTSVDADEDAAGIANAPAFGYNAYYLGGWYEGLHPGGVPRLRFELAQVTAFSMSQVSDSSNQVVFASSAEFSAGTQAERIDIDTPGAHFVVPPIVAETRQWQPLGNILQVNASTAVPAMRYTDQVAVAWADGHTSAVSPNELNDQRKWIPKADTADFTHPQ